MKNLVDQINAQVAAFQANAAAQVEKNNKAAGTRARKAALELSMFSIIAKHLAILFYNEIITKSHLVVKVYVFKL